MNDYYVYILFRETGVPFYVGKGRGRRWNTHEKFQQNADTHRARTIKKILRRREDIPKIKVAEGVTTLEACALEILFISAIGREPFGPLINQTRGGDGLVDPSAAARKKMGANLGKKLSAETRQRMSIARQGFQISAEARARGAAKRVGQKRAKAAKAKMRAAKLGTHQSAEHRAAIGAGNKGKCGHKWTKAERAAKSKEKKGKRWFTPRKGASYQARKPRNPTDRRGRK